MRCSLLPPHPAVLAKWDNGGPPTELVLAGPWAGARRRSLLRLQYSAIPFVEPANESPHLR